MCPYCIHTEAEDCYNGQAFDLIFWMFECEAVDWISLALFMVKQWQSVLNTEMNFRIS
jgi:hypothetical protein